MNSNRLPMIAVTVTVIALVGVGVTGSLAWRWLQSQIPDRGCRLEVSAALDRELAESTYRLSLRLRVQPQAARQVILPERAAQSGPEVGFDMEFLRRGVILKTDRPQGLEEAGETWIRTLNQGQSQ